MVISDVEIGKGRAAKCIRGFFRPDKHAIWILLGTAGHILCICYEDLDIFACSALRDRDESRAFVLVFPLN